MKSQISCFEFGISVIQRAWQLDWSSHDIHAIDLVVNIVHCSDDGSPSHV